MNILFIHQNFPGQFPHLAPALAARGHKVLALSDTENRRPTPVETIYYKTPTKDRIRGIGATFADVSARGDMVAGACSQIVERTGFIPDVVFGHNGWGEMMFVREVWPTARLINYAEFAYQSRGLDSGFDPEFQTSNLKTRTATTARAAHILQSMLQADCAVSPTQFQASTFPPELRGRISVIHDGVNTDEVCPNPNAMLTLPSGQILRTGDEVISFVNRNLEPYRGYHIFMRALPAVLKARPKAQVVLVGGDQQSYGPAPTEGTWKQRFLDEVADQLDMSRVHFTGKVTRADFLSLMQVTRAHAYLTYPFVLSWSMIEAMSAGALVIGSRTPPVEEVIQDGVNGRLVDFFDVQGWSDALIGAMADPAVDDALRAQARATVLEKYDLTRHCLPRLIDLVERVAQMGPAPEIRR